MENYHEKIVQASVLGFGLISASWAAETDNIHECVNNAQDHQVQTASAPSAIQEESPG